MDEADNDYLAYAKAHHFGDTISLGGFRAFSDQAAWLEVISARQRGVPRFGFSIPTNDALNIVARYAPLIEIGAGVAYWAALLQRRGVDIVCFDNEPAHGDHTNYYCSSEYGEDQAYKTVPVVRYQAHTEVKHGSVHTTAEYPDRTLFVAWPTRNDRFAIQLLENYAGRYVIFVGEEETCGGADFWEKIAAYWHVIDGCDLPRWFMLHDFLAVFERNPD